MKDIIGNTFVAPSRERNVVAAFATVTILGLAMGSVAETSYAAQTIRKTGSSAENGTFAPADNNSMHETARNLTGVDSRQNAYSASDALFGGSQFDYPERLAFVTLSSEGLNDSKCGWTRGRFECGVTYGLKSRSHEKNATFNEGAAGTFERMVYQENSPAGFVEPLANIRLVNSAGDKAGAFVVENASLESPVPEPKIIAMMLSGLGLMGFVASRRKL